MPGGNDNASAWVRGFVLALAETHRRAMNSTVICEVAWAANITCKCAREAGVDAFDLHELKKAGVP